VRRLAVDLGVLALFASGALVLALLFHRPSHERAVDLYLLALGTLAMVGLVAATREATRGDERSSFEAALRRGQTTQMELPDLERIRRETALGIARSFDFHARVRPRLREIAAQRLAVRGLDLDGDPDRARAVLGDDVYDLLRVDRPVPDDRFAPGIDAAVLGRLLDTLEKI